MEQKAITHTTFSKKEAIRYGWETTKKNFWLLLVILILFYGVSWVSSFVTGGLYEQDNSFANILGFLIYIATMIVSIEMSYALIKITLKFIDKKKVEVMDLFSSFDAGLLFRYFLVSLLYGLMVGIGLVLLIIPGIYLAITYAYATYIYVDKRTGVLDALKQSAVLTKGIKWQLFVFNILLILLNIAGFLLFFVGLLVTVPITYLAQGYVYRKLSAHHHSK